MITKRENKNEMGYLKYFKLKLSRLCNKTFIHFDH